MTPINYSVNKVINILLNEGLSRIMARVLITGAGGFIGTACFDLFKRKGYEIVATDVPGADLSFAQKAGARTTFMDISDTEALRNIVKGIDIVIHTAGVFDFGAKKSLLKKVNIDGVSNICEACLSAGVKRFVQFSSVGSYGRPRRIPCREEDPKNPRNLYEKSKWEGEKMALSYHKKGLPVAVVRPTLVYGPRSQYGWAIHVALFAVLRDMGVKGMWWLKDGPLGHAVHVDDVALATLILAESPDAPGHSYNVADETPIPMMESFRFIIETVGIKISGEIWNPKILFMTIARVLNLLICKAIPFNPFSLINGMILKHWEEMVKQKGLVRNLRPRIDKDWIGYGTGDHWYDISRIKTLGFKPLFPDFKQGMKETISWYRKNKWIPEL